jgi:hypothetical protein
MNGGAMKKLIFLIILVVAAYLLWRWWHSPDAAVADRGQKVMYDRLWVDHLPKSETDTINLFVAVTEEPIGIFQQTSAWKGNFELFRYEPAGDGKATLIYPQTKEKERIGYRAAACSEKGFDFCMELQGASRGIKRYYSQKGWEVGGHDFRAHADQLVHALPIQPE